MEHMSFSIMFSSCALNLSPPSLGKPLYPFSSSLPSSAHWGQACVSEVHSSEYYRSSSNCQNGGGAAILDSSRLHKSIRLPWDDPFLWLLWLLLSSVYTTHSFSLIKCWSSSGAIHGFFSSMCSLWVDIHNRVPWWAGMFLTTLQPQTKHTQQLLENIGRVQRGGISGEPRFSREGKPREMGSCPQ